VHDEKGNVSTILVFSCPYICASFSTPQKERRISIGDDDDVLHVRDEVDEQREQTKWEKGNNSLQQATKRKNEG